MRLQCCRQISEFADRQGQRAGESAMCEFLLVARIQHHHALAVVVMALLQPTLHGGRRDAGRTRVIKRLAVIATETDDLGLELGLESRERLHLAVAVLHAHVGKACVSLQRCIKGINAFTTAGQKQVDALARHQDGAAQFLRLGTLQQHCIERVSVGKGDKMVGGGIDDHGPYCTGQPHNWPSQPRSRTNGSSTSAAAASMPSSTAIT
ncbi:hypothetical protein D3C71_1036590 [compost metagenome]